MISAPFRNGLREAFIFAIVACLVAAAASLARGGRYYSADSEEPGSENGVAPNVAAVTTTAWATTPPRATRPEERRAS